MSDAHPPHDLVPPLLGRPIILPCPVTIRGHDSREVGHAHLVGGGGRTAGQGRHAGQVGQEVEGF